jgi:hypothetical protein
MARQVYDGRQLYDLDIYCRNTRKESLTTHLDLDHDEAKMRELLIGAIKSDRSELEDIGEWKMIVCEHGQSRTLMEYKTTAES